MNSSLVRWALAAPALVLLAAAPAPVRPAERPAALRHGQGFILRAVAGRMEVVMRPDDAAPRVRFESQVPLAEFQDAVEPQWGFRPDRVGNVFVLARNEIYLIDEDAYYRKLRRCIDDSLAHEYVHFIQVRYRGARLDQDDDTLEAEAVAVQTWFRETYCRPGLRSGAVGRLMGAAARWAPEPPAATPAAPSAPVP